MESKKEKIAFLVTSEKIADVVKVCLHKNDEDILVVVTDISNSLERAKELVTLGIKVIITKIAIKIKIEDEVGIPVISMENTISDYIDLLKKLDYKKEKILIMDYTAPPISLLQLIELLSSNISFKLFKNEEECEKIIRKCKIEGVKILVGGFLVNKYAKECHLNSYEVIISSDTVELYKEVARQVLETTTKEEIKRKVLNNIELMIDNYLKNEIKSGKDILDKINMNEIEKNKIIESLKKNSFSVTKTAIDLGISRTTLWRKLKKFNIEVI